jgi:hypothetical protein
MTYAIFASALFTALLDVGLLATLGRAYWRISRGYKIPRLMARDLALMGGLAWPFCLILAVRTLPEAERVMLIGSLEWALITSVPPIIGIAVWDYFELFVIRPPGRRGGGGLRRRSDDR